MADCYDKILEEFGRNEDFKKAQAWIGQVLIQLMDDLNDPSNYLRIRNCLILLLNLFYDYSGPDHYHKKGKSSSDLSLQEKQQFLNLLREEFNN